MDQQQSKAPQFESQPKDNDRTKKKFQKKGTPDRNDPRWKKNNAEDSSSSIDLGNMSKQKGNEREQNSETVDNSSPSSSALNEKSNSYSRLNAASDLDLELINRKNTNWKYITLIVVLTLLAIYVLYFFDILTIGKKENNEIQQENEVGKNANADDKNNDTEEMSLIGTKNDLQELIDTIIKEQKKADGEENPADDDPKEYSDVSGDNSRFTNALQELIDTMIDEKNKADGEENPAVDDPKEDSNVSGDNSTGTGSEGLVDDPETYLYESREIGNAIKEYDNRKYQTQEDNKDGNNSTLQNIIILGLFSYGLYYYFNKTKKIKKVKSKKVKSKK